MSNGHAYMSRLETELEALHILLGSIDAEVTAYDNRVTYLRHPSQAEPYLLRIRDYIEDYQKSLRESEAASWKKDNG